MRQPQDARGLKESGRCSSGTDLVEEFVPEPKGALGHLRVNLIRPISHANHARLAARTCQAISRSVCVYEYYFGAPAAEQVSSPRAKDSCADDRDIEGFVCNHGGNCSLKSISELSRRSGTRDSISLTPRLQPGDLNGSDYFFNRFNGFPG